MTDDAGSTRHPTSASAPASVDGRAVFHGSTLPTRHGLMDNLIASHPTSPHLVGAGFHARPAWVDGLRDCAAPTSAATPQSRRFAARQLPCKGSRGAGRYLSTLRTCLLRCGYRGFLLPVRGGVPDAPRLCDRRAALDASVRRDQLRPRFPRRSRLASATQRIQSRGHSTRTIFTGAPTSSFHQRREGVEALPYCVSGRFQHETAVARPPGRVRRTRLTCPAAPASPTVRPPGFLCPA